MPPVGLATGALGAGLPAVSPGLVFRAMTDRFGRVAACQSRDGCNAALREFVPTRWPVRASAPSFRTDGLFVEVVRTANPTSHPRRPMPERAYAAGGLSQSQFPDAASGDEQSAALWFQVAVGSGMWLRTGRALWSPCKNTLLRELLDETLRIGPAELVARAVAELDCTFPPLPARARAGAAPDARAALAARIGQLDSTLYAGCRAAGFDCRRPYDIITDAHDPLIVLLGCRLGYDALGATASRLQFGPGAGTRTINVIAEVVELRVPPAAEFGAIRAALMRDQARARPPRRDARSRRLL
jgi:hypothetical protein